MRSGPSGRRTCRRSICAGWPAAGPSRRWRSRGGVGRARALWMRWDETHSMLRFGGELPDLTGREFEATINELVDELRPDQGGAWDTRAHRGADALVHLCRLARSTDDTRDRHTPTLASKANLQVQVPQVGPASIAGIPIPDAKLEQLRANSTIELVLTDDSGAPVAIGRQYSVLSPEDQPGGADTRRPLPLARLRTPPRPRDPPPRPRSLDGTDDISNLATVVHPRPSPRTTHPPRALRPHRQPQPPRRTPPRRLQRPHRRPSTPIRAPTPTPTTTNRLTAETFHGPPRSAPRENYARDTRA
jgi:hypothetical protein